MATQDPIIPEVDQPDLMNDPAYATNTESKSKSREEPDTCRICRGEGTKEEPLFHPCKCSGSIKYVHQDCLMEWLSHSQKKHCELCKTPFRFTKLYDPQMPRTLPTPVFLRQVAIHSFRSLRTWSRFFLVTFVWLGWLPWTMRVVWRGLFWLGDGGWGDAHPIDAGSVRAAHEQAARLPANGTYSTDHTPQLSKEAAASALISSVASLIPKMLSPISQTLNFTADEPTVYRLGKSFVLKSMRRLATPLAPSSIYMHANVTDNMKFEPKHHSWLSDVKVLKTLSRSRLLNDLIIDILEGQLITLFVVVTFVLIFLIREWVVQQQPGINLGGDPNANVAAGEPGLHGALQQPARQPAQPRGDRLGRQHDAEPVGDGPNEPGVAQGGGVPRPRIMARPRPRRRARSPPAEPPTQIDHQSLALPGQNTRSSDTDKQVAMFADKVPEGEIFRFGSNAESEGSNSQQRPSMPTRNSLARAAEIQRTIEEANGATVQQDWPGLHVFMDLWQRADSKPEEVLRIIEDEGRRSELGWVVSEMKRLQRANGSLEAPEVQTPAIGSGGENTVNERNSEGSSQSWEEISRTILGEELGSGNETYRVPVSAQLGAEIGEPGSSAETDHEYTSGGISLNGQGERTRKGKGKLTDALTSTSVTRNGENSHPDTNALQFPDFERPDHHMLNPAYQSDSTTFSDSPNYERFPNENTSREFSSIQTSIEPDISKRASRSASDGSSSDGSIVGQVTSHDAHVTSPPHGAVLLTPQGEVQPQMRQQQHRIGNDDAGPQGLTDRVMAWLWGGVAEVGQEHRQELLDRNEEEVVQDLADQAPFVPIINGRVAAQQAHAPENLALNDEAEGIPDPNDPNAVEEGEDLEGVMELVGMQGPLAGLLQNGMFSAVLISTTVAAGIWFPYIWGKMVLLLLANPVSMMVRLPLRWLSSTADTIVDICIFVIGCLVYWVDTAVRLCLIPVGMVFPSIASLTSHSPLATGAKVVAEGGLERLAKKVVAASSGFAEADFPIFSIVSHEALHSMEAYISHSVRFLFYVVPTSFTGLLRQTLQSPHLIESLRQVLLETARTLPASVPYRLSALASYARSIITVNPLSITLDYPRRTLPLDYSLAHWDTKDRFITVLVGYVFFTGVGFIYLKVSGSLAKAQRGEKVTGVVAETLHQAGGVVKVILIISIEMIVFPLYCGLLLDVALLPLFENVTIISRLRFTLHSPSTSLFVHWFVGTCYMFHFALFVSMCRRILRNGVLYFIRDPDDPTFHPVRDVLERNVSTQLKKIAFSALVYGALVIICLGGVVWGLFYACAGVLPIHWSSNEPVLEFPVDLLFYNFLMPLAVKFIRPSDGLHIMYHWWFRRCATLLRLSHFLFGEQDLAEEGHHVHRTWWGAITGKRGDVDSPVLNIDQKISADNRNVDAYFVRDGTFVRAPASDQVRIPKGAETFLEVTDEDEEVNEQQNSDDGLHGKNAGMFTTVYIPPLFRLRIGLFILLIWLFAATTGIGITVVPLVFGRMVFAYLLPNHVRMNDVYAFSIGIYILGGIFYGIYHLRTALKSIKSIFLSHANLQEAIRKIYKYTLRFVRLLYTYATFALVLPSLAALVVEFYVIIPLHTYLGAGERHIIYFIQDWTLGVLYVKTASRLILWYSTSRPALALRAVVRNGWLNPDVGLATRGFIFPASVLMSAGLLLPLPFGWIANKTYFRNAGSTTQSSVYQYSYPAVLALGLWSVGLYLLCLALKGWKQRIRDEVYLVGERLHNFGEKRADAVKTSSRVVLQG